MTKPSTTKKKKLALKKSEKPAKDRKPLSFSMDNAAGIPLNQESIGNAIREHMGMPTVKSSKSDNLQKSVKPQTIEKDVDGKYDKSKVVFSRKTYTTNPDNTVQKGYQRLSDAELKQLAIMDPYISAIITTRVSQAGTCAQESESRFDKGTRIEEINPLKRDEFESDESYEKANDLRQRHMKEILSWVLNCGTSDKDILNYAFIGQDQTFKKCSLKDYVQAQARNLLTFGRIGTQKFKNAENTVVMFRPVPIETIAPVEHNEPIHIANSDETAPQSLKDAADYNALDPLARPAAWVQRIDGQNDNFFTEDDLSIWYYQKQALFDLDGYPLAPIEMAIYMTFIHQQTLGYLRNQFVKGLATRGMVVIESTDPAVQLDQSDLDAMRDQFHNFVSRTDNSAVTPFIGGPIKAQWIPLSQGPKDMEFLQVEEHVIRALCSAFQISPQEMGYGHLSLPQGGMIQANKQEDIVRGEERGLRMILDVIYEGLNDILYENFPEAKKLFRITYVGVGEDTRDSVIARSLQEINTTATMSGLYADSEKKETIPYGGDVPLAPSFHQNVVRYMKYGEFMEKFFGMEGWSKKPEYDFIIDPNLNQAYQQLKVQPVQEQKAAFEMQLQAQAQQMQMMGQEQQQGQEQHEMDKDKHEQEMSQPQEMMGQSPIETPGQPMAESETRKVPLLEKYRTLKSEPLRKSVKSYFQEWIDAQD